MTMVTTKIWLLTSKRLLNKNGMQKHDEDS